MPQASTKRTELFLDRITVIEARTLCLRSGQSLSRLVDELLRRHVDEEYRRAMVAEDARATG
jgi:hypothetical protein